MKAGENFISTTCSADTEIDTMAVHRHSKQQEVSTAVFSATICSCYNKSVKLDPPVLVHSLLLLSSTSKSSPKSQASCFQSICLGYALCSRGELVREMPTKVQ